MSGRYSRTIRRWSRSGLACGHGLFLNGTIMSMFSLINKASKKRLGKGESKATQEAAA